MSRAMILAPAACLLAGLGMPDCPAAAQTFVRERPIQGAWVRPPSSLSRLDVILDQMADAGFTDLYLETFYHGLASNRSTVFRPRFTFDYLDEAILRAARRGIRVHAWLESAYWDFGGLGSYLLDEHPEWKVVDHLGRTDIGDQPGQRFVNIGIPGVQGMLGAYCAELATDLGGLWGIQTDYHRLPLDNDGSDGQPAPFSYDAWTVAEFERRTGLAAPTVYNPTAGSAWTLFRDFQRERIAEAARAMHDAIVAVDPGVQFSAAIFAAAPTDTGQVSKMQDWPRMTAGGYLPVVVPMAYGSSTSSIRNDLRITVRDAAGAKVVAGLAVINPASRPSIGTQLGGVYGEGLDSFIVFEANALVDEPGVRDAAAAAIASSAPYLSADLDRDRDVDAHDLAAYEAAFAGAYAGQRIRAFGNLRPLDTTLDTWLDLDDLEEMRAQFRAFRFGTDGVVTGKELEVVRRSFTPAGQTFPRHLYDLDGDGLVGCEDLRAARRLADPSVPLGENPDANRDGSLDVLDILAFFELFGSGAEPGDVDGSGVRDIFDILAYFEVFVGSVCP